MRDASRNSTTISILSEIPVSENRIDEDYSVGVNINFQPACLCTWSDRDYRCSHEIAVELYEAAQQ